MFNTKSSPKVSIIMPTYNRAEYIIETIESIRNQTYQNWELIIIDDGSDDNTEERIAQIKDGRIRFFKAGRTGIVGKIKNLGLEKARGELIAFIDPDDLWAPAKIEKQVAALHAYPEAGFSLTGGYNFKSRNEPVEYFYKQTEGIKCDNILISIFKSEVASFIQSLMLRKQCMNIAGPFKETKLFSDVDYILSLATHFKAVILYEPLLYRRLHLTNYSSVNWIKSHYEGLEIIQSYKAKKLLPPKIARDALFRSHIRFGTKCISNNERRRAINSFFKAWINKPFSIVPLKGMGKTILSYFRK